MTLLPLLILPLRLQRPSEPDLVRRFVETAHDGLDPSGAVPPPAPPLLVRDWNGSERERQRLHIYHYDHAEVTLDRPSGRIIGYREEAGLGESLAKQRLTDAQAFALARRFYHAAGWSGDFEPITRGRGDGTPWNRNMRYATIWDGEGESGVSLQIDFVPTVGGVPYDEAWQGRIGVHRRTGRLLELAVPMPDRPAPPASLVPRIRLDEARRRVLGEGVARRDEPLVEEAHCPVRLCVWSPEDSLPERGIPMSWRLSTTNSLGTVRKATLVYKGTVLGARRGSGIGVVIDARSGAVLARQEPALGKAADMIGAGFPTAPDDRLTVPAERRPWRVGIETGGSGPIAWSKPALETLLSTNAPTIGGRRVVLCDDKAAFPAIYDAKANLMGIGGKTFRPGPVLTSRLRRTGRER